MRDLLLLVIILGSVPLSFFQPFYGVLIWIWIAYFNPHRYTFGYMYNFPLAAVVAVPTLFGLIFNRYTNRNIMVRETLLLSLLSVWFVITYLSATQVSLFQGHILDAKAELIRVGKILLMTAVMILVVTTRQKLKYVFLTTALSFTPLVFKGAIFGFRSGGENRVWGPPDSFLADNNGFALAVNMSLPILFYLAREEQNRILRRTLNLAFACGILTVILTYSRGGLLGLIALLLVIAFKSKYRVVSAFLLVVFGFIILTFAPQKWTERMGTLRGHETLDDSAKQRLVSWGTTWNFVKDYPIAGGSFRSLPNVDLFQRYQSAPLPGGFLSSGPHSIYFQTLGEQGFVGLALYLLLIGSCLISLRSINRRARLFPSTNWMVTYANIVEVSLISFLVSGAFLGLADFDLFFQMVASTIILKILWQREIALEMSSERVLLPALVESETV